MILAARMLDPVYSLEEIPEIISLVKEEFAKVSGLKEGPFVNIRLRDNLTVYVFFKKDDYDSFVSEMTLPAEEGQRYKDSVVDNKGHKRIWLEEQAAELECEKRAAELRPHLKIEWVTVIRNPDGGARPVVY